MIASYLAAALVAIVVDGAILPSAPPPHLDGGRVVVPPSLVARLAERTRVGDGTVVAERAGHTCRQPLRDGAVLLAPLARCLGADVEWDARAKVLALRFAAPSGVATHPPYDPDAPRVSPTAYFTPEPARPTPRSVATGVPRPRRTAIPVPPSFPLTTPRPKSL